MYQEEIPLSAYARVGITLGVMLLVGAASFGLLDNGMGGKATRWAAFFIAFLLIGVLIQFKKLTIHMYQDALCLSFGTIRKKILMRDILSCEVYPIRFFEFGGFGIRKSMKKNVGYISQLGDGVRITVKNLKQGVVFSTHNPEAIYAAIQRNKGAAV